MEAQSWNRVQKSTIYRPAAMHLPHADSKLCQDFHWVPYPLGLMPYDSWYYLHHREDVQPKLPFRCPVCRLERRSTPHMRKLFLAAERLTWEEELVSSQDKDLNEKLNWKFNYELGIVDPFVEDPEQAVGGKNSYHNRFYPYMNEKEMKLALNLISLKENLTETSWAVWIGTQLDLEEVLHESKTTGLRPSSSFPISNKRDVSQASKDYPTSLKVSGAHKAESTVSPDLASESFKIASNRPAPLSSSDKSRKSTQESQIHPPQSGSTSTANASNHEKAMDSATGLSHSKHIASYRTLQDFYSLLDKIERTSYVGTPFLEAYAERLKSDMCQRCWFGHYVVLDVH